MYNLKVLVDGDCVQDSTDSRVELEVLVAKYHRHLLEQGGKFKLIRKNVRYRRKWVGKTKDHQLVTMVLVKVLPE